MFLFSQISSAKNLLPQAAGEHFSAETAAKVLQRLPELLGRSG